MIVAKMFIVPRTPISPTRKSQSPTMSRSSFSPVSTVSNEHIQSVKDVYDQFSEIYFAADMKIRNVLLSRIINFVGHPAYAHLLRTMDEKNAHHVMGYLRSQRSFEMYVILDQTVNSPLPTKDDFLRTSSVF
jgi:hypothetical protein